MTKPTENATRRHLLKVLPLSAGAVWAKPAIYAVTLPAHASTTVSMTSEPQTGAKSLGLYVRAAARERETTLNIVVRLTIRNGCIYGQFLSRETLTAGTVVSGSFSASAPSRSDCAPVADYHQIVVGRGNIAIRMNGAPCEYPVRLAARISGNTNTIGRVQQVEFGPDDAVVDCAAAVLIPGPGFVQIPEVTDAELAGMYSANESFDFPPLGDELWPPPVNMSSDNYDYLYYINSFVNERDDDLISGFAIRWSGTTVPVQIDPQFDEARAKTWIERWTPYTGIQYRYETYNPDSVSTYPGITLRYVDANELGGSLCGWATWNTTGGRITRCDIRIANPQRCLDLDSVVTHEMGHALGYFRHLDDNGGPTSGVMTSSNPSDVIHPRSMDFFRLLYALDPGTDINDRLSPGTAIRARSESHRYDPNSGDILIGGAGLRPDGCSCGARF